MRLVGARRGGDVAPRGRPAARALRPASRPERAARSSPSRNAAAARSRASRRSSSGSRRSISATASSRRRSCSAPLLKRPTCDRSQAMPTGDSTRGTGGTMNAGSASTFRTASASEISMQSRLGGRSFGPGRTEADAQCSHGTGHPEHGPRSARRPARRRDPRLVLPCAVRRPRMDGGRAGTTRRSRALDGQRAPRPARRGRPAGRAPAGTPPLPGARRRTRGGAARGSDGAPRAVRGSAEDVPRRRHGSRARERADVLRPPRRAPRRRRHRCHDRPRPARSERRLHADRGGERLARERSAHRRRSARPRPPADDAHLHRLDRAPPASRRRGRCRDLHALPRQRLGAAYRVGQGAARHADRAVGAARPARRSEPTSSSAS